MDATKRKRLYELPEYRVLDAKRKKLVSFHVLDGVAFSRACTMLTLNKTREAKRPDVKICLAAFNRAQDPDGKSQLFETVRRMEILWYGIQSPAYDEFSTVNLPWGPEQPGMFLTPDGKTVDASGLPVPTPPKPDLSKRPCDICGANYPHGPVCRPCQFKAAGRPYEKPL